MTNTSYYIVRYISQGKQSSGGHVTFAEIIIPWIDKFSLNRLIKLSHLINFCRKLKDGHQLALVFILGQNTTNLPAGKTNSIKRLIPGSWREKYQLLMGDNWDRNVLPSFRTPTQKTISIHLFNLIAVDRITPEEPENSALHDISDIDISTYIPSVNEQYILVEELTYENKTQEVIQLLKKLTENMYP